MAREDVPLRGLSSSVAARPAAFVTGRLADARFERFDVFGERNVRGVEGPSPDAASLARGLGVTVALDHWPRLVFDPLREGRVDSARHGVEADPTRGRACRV
jgi:hypothetical protein